MKQLLILITLSLTIEAHACIVTNASMKYVGMVSGGVVLDSKSKLKGYVSSDVIVNASSTWVGTLMDDVIMRANGSTAAFLSGDIILNSAMQIKGYGSDCSKKELAAAALLLF